MLKILLLTLLLPLPLFAQVPNITSIDHLRTAVKLVSNNPLAGDVVNSISSNEEFRIIRDFFFYVPSINNYQACQLISLKPIDRALAVHLSFTTDTPTNWSGVLSIDIENNYSISSIDPRNRGWNLQAQEGEIKISCNNNLTSPEISMIETELKNQFHGGIIGYNPSLDFHKKTIEFINEAQFLTSDERKVKFAPYKAIYEGHLEANSKIADTITTLWESGLIGDKMYSQYHIMVDTQNAVSTALFSTTRKLR